MIVLVLLLELLQVTAINMKHMLQCCLGILTEQQHRVLTTFNQLEGRHLHAWLDGDDSSRVYISIDFR